MGQDFPSTGRGVNVVPLTYADDLNNTTASGTVATWSTIANLTAGWNAIDVNQDSANEYYCSKWNRDTYTINQFYERMKYATRNGETTTLYNIPGEMFRGITHAIDIGTPSGGTFAEGGATNLSWGSGATAGTAKILANDTTSHVLYVQLLTGVVPGNAVTVTQGAVTATTAGSNAVVEKPVSAPFCGASTGPSLVGAYGFTLEYADLAVNDKITALDGTTRQPPNNVTFTVNGVQSGWYVMVAPYDAGNIDYNQLTLNGTLTGAAVTSVVVNEAIPANTPSSGTIRISGLMAATPATRTARSIPAPRPSPSRHTIFRPTTLRRVRMCSSRTSTKLRLVRRFRSTRCSRVPRPCTSRRGLAAQARTTRTRSSRRRRLASSVRRAAVQRSLRCPTHKDGTCRFKNSSENLRP